MTTTEILQKVERALARLDEATQAPPLDVARITGIFGAQRELEALRDALATTIAESLNGNRFAVTVYEPRGYDPDDTSGHVLIY